MIRVLEECGLRFTELYEKLYTIQNPQYSPGAIPSKMPFCLLVELNGKFLLILSNMPSESMKWVGILK